MNRPHQKSAWSRVMATPAGGWLQVTRPVTAMATP